MPRFPLLRSRRLARWLLRGAFGFALVLSLYFAVRLGLGALYWSDPAHRDQSLEGWMPLGYVGRSWDIPREAMMRIAGVDADAPPRRSLEAIAREQGLPLPVLIERLTRGIALWREQAP